jgi:hypothetical protein
VPSITPDGRFIVFRSTDGTLVPNDNNGILDVFVHDRDTDGDGVYDEAGAILTERVNVKVIGVGLEPDDPSSVRNPPSISDDGRYVAFESDDALTGDGNGQTDCFLRDRLLGTTKRISDPPNVVDVFATRPAISGDGRFVVMDSNSALVTPDLNSRTDVFLYDVQNDRHTRVSVSSTGTEATGGNSTGPAISANGRYIAYRSGATNLVPGDTNGLFDIFRYDRITGSTERVSVASDGTQGDGHSGGTTSSINSFIPTVTSVGPWVIFRSVATNLVPGGCTTCLHGPDQFDATADVTGDGDSTDTVLQAVNTTSGALTSLCPSGDVAVSAGAAAFLRPETQGAAPGCPGTSDLNGDGDAFDEVVHLWTGSGTALNLDRAATAVALSPARVAALVSEHGEGGTNLNGDLDPIPDDTVLQVYDRSGGVWAETTEAADAVGVVGSNVVYIQPEASQDAERTGDNDFADRVFGVYDAATNTFPPVVDAQLRMQPAEEFVVGTEVVAFRTVEASLCGTLVTPANCGAPPGCPLAACDLNADGDCCDDVMQAYDLTTQRLVNSGQAVTPCALEACDPRLPYRAFAVTVKFLTRECEQHGNVFAGCSTGGSDLNEDGDARDLVIQILNVRTGALRVVGAIDEDGGVVGDPLSDPLDEFEAGTETFVSFGQCLEPGTIECDTDADCATGFTCLDDIAELVPFHCARPQGLCLDASDCAPGSYCVGRQVVATASDQDDDDIPDVFDNCPLVPNEEQDDEDADEIGDACDLQTCGNDVREFDEACDGPDLGTCATECDECTCVCPDIADPKASIKVKTKKEAGQVTAKFMLPLAGDYTGQPVTIRLEDSNGLIATQNVGPLPPLGSSTTKWMFKSKANGIQKVQLSDKRLKLGAFQVKVKAKRWFASDDATDDAESTILTIRFGAAECYSHEATSKQDDF